MRAAPSISFNEGRQTIAVPPQIASGRGRSPKPSPYPRCPDLCTILYLRCGTESGFLRDVFRGHMDLDITEKAAQCLTGTISSGRPPRS
jgi:hypothetical protein